MKQHWLYKKHSIKKLWISGAVLLLMTILAEFFVELHAHFSQADWFSFNAVFGFFACFIMVFFARLLGFLIRRKDDYYDK